MKADLTEDEVVSAAAAATTLQIRTRSTSTTLLSTPMAPSPAEPKALTARLLVEATAKHSCRHRSVAVVDEMPPPTSTACLSPTG